MQKSKTKKMKTKKKKKKKKKRTRKNETPRRERRTKQLAVLEHVAVGWITVVVGGWKKTVAVVV
jgi:Na+/glutamate symporter